MANDGPNWKGLLNWSIANADGASPPSNLSEEDRKWFLEAMQAGTVDVIQRMREIILVMKTPEEALRSQGVTPSDIEDMLEELQDHVMSIDNANDLHAIGGLASLLENLKNSHANIRAKAAEVVSTIVQNNPRSQELVMKANGLEPLLSNFISDSDMTSRTKALGAITSLIQHNKPGITAFRLGNGYEALKDALSSENVRFQRKALHLIHCLLNENSWDYKIASEMGFPRILLHLAASEDAEVREAALRGLLDLAQYRLHGEGGKVDIDNEKLKQLLEKRIKSVSLMSAEELGAAREERHLIDSLWNIHYNEPSSLRDKGLLHLPGEDAPPPDVASKHFEPPLRASAAHHIAEGKHSEEKKQAPSSLGPGPGPQAANAQGKTGAGVRNDERNNKPN